MIQDTTPGAKTFVIPPPPEDARTSFLSNILAIAGFIIVIVVVIWGLVHLANLSRGWFGSFFGGNAGTSIEVTAPETVESGKAFDLTWEYSPPTPGMYAFLYQCADNLDMRTTSPINTLIDIPCGAAYTIPADGSKLSLTPALSGEESLSVPLSIIFLPTATGTQAQGSATVTVVAAGTTPTPYATPGVTPPPPSYATPTQYPTPQYPTPSTAPYPTPASAPRTPADLSVRIVSVVPDSYGATTVTFDIANNGGTATGVYYFTAQLPTSQAYTYSSPAQASLTPGSHIVNTLRFTQVLPGGGMFSVSVDPSNMVRESNESNNYASQFVNAPYTPYNYNYPYQNNPNPYVQYYPYAY